MVTAVIITTPVIALAALVGMLARRGSTAGSPSTERVRAQAQAMLSGQPNHRWGL